MPRYTLHPRRPIFYLDIMRRYHRPRGNPPDTFVCSCVPCVAGAAALPGFLGGDRQVCRKMTAYYSFLPRHSHVDVITAEFVVVIIVFLADTVAADREVVGAILVTVCPRLACTRNSKQSVNMGFTHTRSS